MVDPQLWTHLASVLIYAATGLFVFGAGFILFDRLTPYHLWTEIVEHKNNALAIVVAGMCLSMAIIIEAAIR